MTARDDATKQGRTEDTSRHEGEEQHGWSPDVDATRQEENPSAHRSFHPEEHAPEADEEHETQVEDRTPAGTGESSTAGGEEHAKRYDEAEGKEDRGPRGPSGRPSGEKKAEHGTGVDPQGPSQG